LSTWIEARGLSCMKPINRYRG